MIFIENLLSSIRYLLAHPLRTVLTILGITIGIAALLSMIGLGEGTRQNIIEEMERLGGTGVIIISAKEPFYIDQTSIASENDRLTRRDMEAFKRASNFIERIAPIISLYDIFFFDRNEYKGQYLGITQDYSIIRDWTIDKGRFIVQSDIEKCNMVCVIGSRIREELFKDINPMGKKIRIGSEEYTVVGIMSERKLEVGRWMNDLVLVPITTIEKRLLIRDYLSKILIKAKATNLVPIVMKQVKHVIRGNHNDPSKFNIFSQVDVIYSMNRSSMLMRFSFGVIAVIVLLVGGIGIMNLMLVSVTERTGEIGIRKAVGAKDIDILWQFLQEAVIMSITGGVFGIIVGLHGGDFISLIISKYLDNKINSIISIKAIGFSTILSFLIGIFFGLYPAIRAARIDPSKALSYE
jgi:putative ABC transport system permease protein